MRNHRRTQTGGLRPIRWLKTYHEALLILGVLLLLGLGAGYAIRSTMDHEQPEELLFPKEPEYVVLNHSPQVVDCFKVWTESPKGNSLLMVWSDGQVWRARTDNQETVGRWEFMVHVRLGETP